MHPVLQRPVPSPIANGGPQPNMTLGLEGAMVAAEAVEENKLRSVNGSSLQTWSLLRRQRILPFGILFLFPFFPQGPTSSV